MDHSKNQKLRDNVQKNRDSQKVAHRRQRAPHESRAICRVKKQIPQEWGSASASVFDTVARTQHDGNQRLKDESQPSGSMEAHHNVVQKSAR